MGLHRLAFVRLYAELAAYDQSGVERSPLTRVALEAAHLAEILSAPPLIRAELPVVLKDASQVGMAPDPANQGLNISS